MLSFNVKYAIQILCELEQAALNDTRVTTTWLRENCGMDRTGLSNTIRHLVGCRMIEKFNAAIRLHADLDTVSLYDLIIAVDGDLRIGSICVVDGWSPILRKKYATAKHTENLIKEELSLRLQQITIRDMVTTKASHDSIRNKN